MLGELTKKEMLDMLQQQSYGNLGCCTDGEMYVVPINFIYQDNALYAHSGPGKKIDIMRKNPKVCFQLSDVKNIFNWKSIIINGTFEELHDQERQQVLQNIIYKVLSLNKGKAKRPSHGIEESKLNDIIVYKIQINEITGRFETHKE